ncbi:RNA-directed DNA polymerase (Reverse transcriptase) [Gossypium australe]|uniref:RNA-directed DNA polymerase (Reverse transcriptase) n=1 Tax=Gossypium australe TaxID=47621 RepID=A0A5B6W3F5_9ROSI|nr:RNA-directed DNA polymerase (Reverse transcriptase) [Gossypium australe]
MEWLGLFIHSGMKAGIWDPIRLSRFGPPVSHLFFADDLVIFCKARMDQACYLKSIITLFCEISGHKISARKSNIFFSKNTEDESRNQISQLFGFHEVQNLGKYLGVPLLHDRVTKNTLNFVVDKIRRKLQSWDARKLSIAGRITLAQSVLLSIPSYFMQTMMIPKGVCENIEKIVRHFIWGGTGEKSKMALVGWDKICQPRGRGGLGIRKLNDQNSSFFMKIGFNLTSKTELLWVNVLRSKYGWKEQIPESISRNKCSHLWKSLSKLWPSIRENLIWSIGDGTKVRYWRDPWIPGMGPLTTIIPSSLNLNLDCSVKDMVNTDGSWNLELFRVWVPKEVINRITSIPPPHPNAGADRVIWARSGTGIFSVRTAYWSLQEDKWQPHEEHWKIPWKFQGPQRVRLFLWLAFKQRLLTNSERARRGINYSSSCHICGHSSEDLEHALRDCPTAKEVWMLVLPDQIKQRFFSAPLQDWLIFNLCFHESLQGSDLTWSKLFGTIAWRIWKNRNLLIFQNISWTASEVVQVSNCWARQYDSTRGVSKIAQQEASTTNTPGDNWVHLSTDGAVNNISGAAAAGGVARDHEGNWILGFNRFLGNCTPIEAEFWGILDGILILLNKGYKRINIMSDNIEVVQNLSTLDSEDPGIAVLRRTQPDKANGHFM